MKASAVILLSLAWAAPAHATVKLPALFSDHMVLQAGTSVPVWGWADAGEDITVEFAGQKKTARADAKGAWQLKLDPLAPSNEPRDLVVSSNHQSKIVNHKCSDVLIGEVWLGGGQSNMSYQVAAYNVTPETLAEAKAQTESVRPAIRFFMTSSRGADEPQEDVAGRWVIAEPDTISKCSAVAWYFGLALHQKLRTPVGLVVSSVGGTGAEMWISRKALDATSAGPAIWKRHEQSLASYSKEVEEKYKSDEAAWKKANPTRELMIKNKRVRPKPVYTPDGEKVPTRLYNGKIAGLGAYAVKGIIWFQADGNGKHPEEYPELIQTLIRTWRAQWHAELPFYYVEMNNMHALQTMPDEDKPLPKIREAQNAALKLARTGVVTAIDLGIAEDAHFPVKKPVGDRLANLVLSEVYHQDLGEVHSPEFASYKIEDDKIRIALKHAKGLRSRVGEVRGFTVKTTGGKWTWADATIDGSDLLVWSASAPNPQELRYGWAENPIVSLENEVGLPLRPFHVVLKDKE